MIKTKIIADSINYVGNRLTTWELSYPRYIHAEVMTHRVFSRNAQSTRAIPVEKAIQLVIDNPVEPIFMENQRGMQADTPLTGEILKKAITNWKSSQKLAIAFAKEMNHLGVHKQVTSRILEPYSHIRVILSSTEMENFFRLRIAPDAQQEICVLAESMKRDMTLSIPRVRGTSWHLPYISSKELLNIPLDYLIQASVARCARVSYLNHDKTNPNIEKDMELYSMLKESRHLSPFEHVAIPSGKSNSNFVGWKQHREDLEWSES